MALRFALAGEHGVYMPLVLDLEQGWLHWLDIHAKGSLEFNNVHRANKDITRIGPALIDYFASGARPSMFDLALLHASGASRVHLRGDGVREFVRRPGENPTAFHARLAAGDADEPRSRLPETWPDPPLALLFRGDLDLPPSSQVYALFPDRLTPTLAAADLLR